MRGTKVNRVLLTALLLIVQTAASAREATTAERIARIESGFRPIEVKGEAPLKLTLADWMKLVRVPGLSVAVFDNFQVVWTKAYGVVQRGKLSLDDNVNDKARHLEGLRQRIHR